MNVQRIEVDERAGRRRREKKEKKKNRGKEKRMDIVSSTQLREGSDFHCDVSE